LPGRRRPFFSYNKLLNIALNIIAPWRKPTFPNFNTAIDKFDDLSRSFFILQNGTNPSEFPPGSVNQSINSYLAAVLSDFMKMYEDGKIHR
jgi:hypothetical protein